MSALTLSPGLQVVDALALGAHAGQVDKNGVPYIAHPRAVAKLVPQVPLFRSLDEWQRQAAVMAALLHDVLEDTAVTKTDMVSIGIPVPVVDIVALLTFDSERGSRAEYYERIRNNQTALVVKIADVAHNTSPARTAQLSEADRERLSAKYAAAIDALTAGYPSDRDWLLRHTR